MKRMLILLLPVAAWGCDTKSSDCSDTCNGAIPAGITDCVEIDSTKWMSGSPICDINCELAGCIPFEGTKQEGETCSGTGQGDCLAGLTCIPVSNTTAACGVSCDSLGAGSECGANRFCLGGSNGVGICFDQAAHGELCLDMNESRECSKAGDECIPMLGDIFGSCTTRCDPTTINTTSTCGMNESCLETQYYSIGVPCTTATAAADCAFGNYCVDRTSAGYGFRCATTPSPTTNDEMETKSCTEANAGTDCKTAEGWECVSFAQPTGEKCALNRPLCGTKVPFWDGSSSEDANSGATVVASQFLCGNGARLCGTLNPSGPAADVSCYTKLFGPTSEVGICIGFCEDAAGNPLSCGDGATCVQPLPDDPYVRYWEKQSGGGVVCTTSTANTDCDPLFATCINFTSSGWQCARPTHVCQML